MEIISGFYKSDFCIFDHFGPDYLYYFSIKFTIQTTLFTTTPILLYSDLSELTTWNFVANKTGTDLCDIPSDWKELMVIIHFPIGVTLTHHIFNGYYTIYNEVFGGLGTNNYCGANITYTNSGNSWAVVSAFSSGTDVHSSINTDYLYK